jgi:biopolymer transport protein ExbB
MIRKPFRAALDLYVFCRVVSLGFTLSTSVNAGAPAKSDLRNFVEIASSREAQSGLIERENDSINNGQTRVSRVAPSESFLGWMIRASGPIGVLIVLMSFYLMALVIWMFLNYRTIAVVPTDLLRELHRQLEKSNYNEAYHRLIQDPSFLAHVLAAGVRKLPAGLAQAQRAMELANEDATMAMEHRTTYLATVGTLGPMIGLVGTVYGMIIAFRVIAHEGSTPEAGHLAAGISTALFTTLEGIAISIPAIFFYALFRNRIARLSLEVGLAAEPLLERFTPWVGLSMPKATLPSSGSPPAYPHPFAVSAARLTATNPPQTALPAAEWQSNADEHRCSESDCA